MTLSVRIPSFVTMRQVEYNFWKVLADWEPFPGGYVTMLREELNQEGKPVAVARKFAGRLDEILELGLIKGTTDPLFGRPVPTDDLWKLDDDELEFLNEVNDLIIWGQENSYWLEIGEKPADPILVQQGATPVESDLSVSPV